MTPEAVSAHRPRTPLRAYVAALAVLASLSCSGQELNACATTLDQLRVLTGDPAFPLRWEETTMADGKPLVVSIAEHNGVLQLEFIKSGEGLWLQSAGLICKRGAQLEARFSAGQIRLGPAANWLLRMSAGHGGEFKLTRTGAEQMRIATTGWSGTFAPKRLP